jgi:predicted amidophosphoribosyltransferase
MDRNSGKHWCEPYDCDFGAFSDSSVVWEETDEEFQQGECQACGEVVRRLNPDWEDERVFCQECGKEFETDDFVGYGVCPECEEEHPDKRVLDIEL